jgi:hypothetical protein
VSEQALPTFHFGGAAVLERPTPIVVEGSFRKDVTVKKTQAGGHLTGLRVFKTGTFKDMFGSEYTWESAHLEQMVTNFKLLRDGGNLPNIPVRADHERSVNSVVGYIDDVYLDEDGFLAADIEFTEPDAFQKYERGTFRSRSLEIGMYETNNGAVYFPVVVGLAFVDIPAVEGLFSRSDARTTAFSLVDDKETPVAEQQTPPEEEQEQQTPEGEVPPAGTPAPVPEGQAPPAGSPAPGGEGESTGQERPPAESQQRGTATPSGVTPVADNAATVMAFRVNGAQTQDYRAVQAHIDTLENTVQESIRTGRASYVQSLARDNKIAATQIEGMTALAQGMNDAQFEEFKKIYAEAPSSGLFALHGGGEGGTPTVDGEPSDLEIAEETVINHRRAGMPEDQIKATGSYQMLVKAGKAQA